MKPAHEFGNFAAKERAQTPIGEGDYGSLSAVPDGADLLARHYEL